MFYRHSQCCKFTCHVRGTVVTPLPSPLLYSENWHVARRNWLFGGGGHSFSENGECRFFSSRAGEGVAFSILLWEWEFNLPLDPVFHLSACSCAFTSLRFFICDFLLLPTSVAVQSADAVNTSQRFILHARKQLQRGVATLSWITSPDWLLRILNNFSFSKVVWLYPYCVLLHPTQQKVVISLWAKRLFIHACCVTKPNLFFLLDLYYEYTSSITISSFYDLEMLYTLKITWTCMILSIILIAHMYHEWYICGLLWFQEWIPKRLVFRSDWTTCSKNDSQHNQENLHGHLTSTKIFTLIMNKIFIRAPNIMKKVATTSN